MLRHAWSLVRLQAYFGIFWFCNQERFAGPRSFTEEPRIDDGVGVGVGVGVPPP
jgi:hypothetical protein